MDSSFTSFSSRMVFGEERPSGRVFNLARKVVIREFGDILPSDVQEESTITPSRLEGLSALVSRQSRDLKLEGYKSPYADARAAKEKAVQLICGQRAVLEARHYSNHNRLQVALNTQQATLRLDQAKHNRKVVQLEGKVKLLKLQAAHMQRGSERQEEMIVELNDKVARLDRLHQAIIDLGVWEPVLHGAVYATNPGSKAEKALVHSITGAYAEKGSVWHRVISAVVGLLCSDVAAPKPKVTSLGDSLAGVAGVKAMGVASVSTVCRFLQ